MKKTAFTLAETLITLAIIGVVAAITIPSLMQSTQDAELKSAWKKAYSDLDNATRQMAQDNGGNLKDLASSHNEYRNKYKSYLKYSKLCDSYNNYGVCWHNSNEFWSLDGSITSTNTHTHNAGMILTNGTLLSMNYSNQNCEDTTRVLLRCGRMDIDVNGFKGPNRYGKDIFTVHITEHGIKPYGTQEDDIKDKCIGSTGTTSGFGCSAEYLKQ